MSDRRLVFLGPGRVAVEDFDAGSPGPGEVELTTCLSAISAGTEALLWHGHWPDDLPLDSVWSPKAGTAGYPVSYGYASVGRVSRCGDGVPREALGRLAFSFTPHQSRSLVAWPQVIVLPEGLSAEDGVFVASMETAVSVVHDAAPTVGDQIGVWGLGTIGTLTAALLAGPFSVNAWDPVEYRRTVALGFGVNTVARSEPESCDVAIELSGSGAALAEALAAVRFAGRVVAGSWYGAQPVSLPLGGAFHRSRIEIVSSQVSTLAPRLAGRWTKERRLGLALERLVSLNPSRLITHRFPLDRATEAYQQACDAPEKGMQVVFTYETARPDEPEGPIR